MKTHKKKRILPLLLSVILVTLLAGPTLSMAAQPSVNLGTTSTYAVLAGSAITNTGTTTINGDAGGDIGLFPGSAYTGNGTVSLTGTAHITDAAASQAKADLMTAYLDAAGRTPVTIIPTELGGTTLKPGTYKSNAGKFELTGTLTLDAEGDPEGVFVFITASTLVTASDSNIVLQDEARYCRTFWGVGSSATLGTNSHFVGHIFAMSSITATTGATVQGQLMAINGAVTLDSNTITNGICEVASNNNSQSNFDDEPLANDEPSANDEPIIIPPATLHVIKHVINDNGGTSDASLFNIHVRSSDTQIDVAGSPANGVESPGTTYTLAPGNYTISEASFAGDANQSNFTKYALSFSGDASASGQITLASGESKTVILTNDDILVVTPVPPVVSPSTNIPNAGVPQVVTPTQTVTGGELPRTATPWYNLLLAGALFLFVGVYGLSTKIR